MKGTPSPPRGRNPGEIGLERVVGLAHRLKAALGLDIEAIYQKPDGAMTVGVDQHLQHRIAELVSDPEVDQGRTIAQLMKTPLVGEVVKRSGQIVDIDLSPRTVQSHARGKALADNTKPNAGFSVQRPCPVFDGIARQPHGCDQRDEFRIGPHIADKVEQIVRAMTQPQAFDMTGRHGPGLDFAARSERGFTRIAQLFEVISGVVAGSGQRRR